MLSNAKLALRISHNTLDGEIEDLISAARQELILSGISADMVKAETNMDPLIKRAIITYVKANFGFDNPDSEKLNQAFQSLKAHMSLAGDYHAIS